jgi:hypothetical protein
MVFTDISFMLASHHIGELYRRAEPTGWPTVRADASGDSFRPMTAGLLRPPRGGPP